MNNKIEKIITAELALHPRAALQDFYKLFFQSFFGAEHALADVESARNYFKNELLNLPKESNYLIQDISVSFPIYRVSLQVIENGLLSAEELFEAFLKSTKTTVKTSTQDWLTIWQEIEKSLMPILSPYETDISDLRKAAEEGSTVHHSQLYRDLYKPHYRIICGEFLPSSLFLTKTGCHPEPDEG